MSMIYLEVDGKPVPASECDWIVIAPCGCLEGVMVVQSKYCETPRALTADDARREFHTNKVAAKRSLDEGFQFKLVTHDQFRAMAFGDCTHTPKWGVERAPLPDGYAWATLDGHFGRKTHLKHMVPAGVFPRPGEKYPERDVKALCGNAAKGWWDDDEHLLWDCEPCLKCDAAAKALAPTLEVQS